MCEQDQGSVLLGLSVSKGRVLSDASLVLTLHYRVASPSPASHPDWHQGLRAVGTVRDPARTAKCSCL